MRNIDRFEVKAKGAADCNCFGRMPTRRQRKKAGLEIGAMIKCKDCGTLYQFTSGYDGTYWSKKS